MNIEMLETELMKLSAKERAVITYKLLKSLENESNQDFEDVWIDEALSRYKKISEGKDVLIDKELVIKEAKSKYR